MVRINSTIHLVSSYDISWFIQRNREEGSATISRFFRPDDPNTVLFITGAMIYAFKDAKARLELDGRPWSDPFKRNAPLEPSNFEDDAGDNIAGPDDFNALDDSPEPEDDIGESGKRRKYGDGGETKKKKRKVDPPATDRVMVCMALHKLISSS
jgi:hypothetical protein